SRLPFTLTEGQVKVGAEIADDLAAEHPMHRLLQGEVGSGKAQPLDALVLTPHGFVPMGDITVGTEVVTPSGEVALVDGVFPQGVRDVWRMTLQDGTSVECDDEHLWVVVRGPQGTPPQLLTTRQIREDLHNPDGVRKWSIAPVVPVDLGSDSPPSDPYETGRRLAAEENPGRVPGAFRNASAKDRHAFVQGWMDVRGFELGESFSAPTPEIGGDIAWLVRSLGGLATALRGLSEDRDDGVVHFTTCLPEEYPPFRDKGESSKRHVPPVAGRRWIESVDHVGRKPVQCISVAHPEHMYVTDNFTPTHNTMIALRAMLTVVDAGGQAAMLAPTEVLAQQHHRSIVEMMGDLADGPGMLGGSEVGTKVTLLTGSMGVPARRAALLDLVTGEAGIVIGTHALIEDKVKFHDLGLVVVDEQHRFGVEQRDALRGKSDRPPHLLVMTATPIPRTVAMTVFGDLETSVLDQLPSGRSPIATHVVPAREKPNFLERTWERLREEVAKGHQAYIVCPRIGDEEDDPKSKKPKRGKKAVEEDLPAEAYLDDPDDIGADAGEGAEKRPPLAVLEVAAGLESGPLAGLRIGVLHGRMAPDAKDEVMRRFTAGDVDVLVATTVIEVGVNVPNATVMVIMDSERFGVSQLHQLRGRVGRGSAPGLCLLVSDMPAGTAARERLDAVAATLDGFELSRIDLEQRREGDVLGEAQSGSRSSLRMLAVVRDEDVIVAARDEATEIVARDPQLAEHPELRSALASLLDEERAEYLDKG
ncbi:MAG TPA: helicase-related protein, partial [Yinghuangia sp.]|nr:helicase-related protein [Yinghuangia sp.]